jgi:hypothetical protein
MNHGSAHISFIFARVLGLRSNMRPIRGRHEGGASLLRSFMGPLLIGGGGGVLTFCNSEPEGACSIAFPEAIICDSVWTRVVLEELRVVLRETVVDVEAELLGVVYGFGEDAKFLNEGSDMRGAFQGKRRMTIQQKIIANDQISAGCGSYRISVHTSGARYGSLPTMPFVSLS